MTLPESIDNELFVHYLVLKFSINGIVLHISLQFLVPRSDPCNTKSTKGLLDFQGWRNFRRKILEAGGLFRQ